MGKNAKQKRKEQRVGLEQKPTSVPDEIEHETKETTTTNEEHHSNASQTVEKEVCQWSFLGLFFVLK